MYTEKVMDHFQHPRNVGEIENASGVGTVGNAKCGDIMRIYLDIDDDQIIRDVKFKTFGCGAAVATSSMATELVKGKSVQEAMEVTNKAVMEALDGLPRSMRPSGIMTRSSSSRSKGWKSRRRISMKARKRKKRNTDEQGCSGDVRRSGFLRSCLSVKGAGL